MPRLPVEQALASAVLPLLLNWSEPGRRVDLADRGDRARAYGIVLREGQVSDLLAYLDGALLADLWRDMVLPRDVRAAWAPVVEPLPAGNAELDRVVDDVVVGLTTFRVQVALSGEGN